MTANNGGMRLPENALPDSIVRLNKDLGDWYGIDTVTGRPIFRIVFANNEYEMRYGTYRDETPEGFFIREVTELREVPKYDAPDYKNKYILERLIYIELEDDQRTLPVSKLSYEPLWTFENVKDEAVPPSVEGTRFIIDLVLSREGKRNMNSYKHPTAEEMKERKEMRISKIIEDLYGDESTIADALHLRSGVVNPGVKKDG